MTCRLFFVVHVGVFGLFHPQVITVKAGGPQAIQVESGGRIRTLERSETVSISVNALVSAVGGGPADIQLGVPGKIERTYFGVVRLRPSAERHELTAVVDLDLEVAVASIVAAEVVKGTPLEALKAQAVAARSFLVASPKRHRDFDFCDTTHCQFLRSRPAAGSAADLATKATEGLVLTYRGVPIAALYSAACGGGTVASEGNVPGAHGYRYQAVSCAYCLRHPGNAVRGHRLGMCQQGAAGMAADGASYREILDHYYPGTKLAHTPARTSIY